MELAKTYFFTATIVDWKPLLKDDKFKDIIIASLRFLSENNLVNVYAFVIMPNHIHLILEMLRLNKKEMPHASLMKYTSHKFLEELRKNDPGKLSTYQVDSITRKHHFWQRDALPVELYSDKVFEQKLEYIHNNPVHEKWGLSKEPAGYKYSSAKFYETGRDEFGFLKHYSEWQ